MANVVSYGGQTYLTNGIIGDMFSGNSPNIALGLSGRGMSTDPRSIENAVKRGWLTPYQMQPQQAQAPAPQPLPTQSIQPQLNRLTQQASNALYGGLLGYNPQPMMSGGQNPQSFAAPQGNFRDAFSNMQGLLGQGNSNWRGGY